MSQTTSKNDLPAIIRVVEPCDCTLPWWQCVTAHNREVVAVYECPGIDDGPTPTRAARAEVAQLHPGMTLVHLG